MKNVSIIWLLVMVLVSGCIEEIDVDTSRNVGQLVITGRITNTPGPHYVYISRTSALNRITESVGGARVSLYDGDGNAYHLNEELPGIHSLSYAEFNAVPGRTYHIEVTMPDGKQYLSRPETMPEILAIDALEGRFTEISQINSLGIEISNPYYEVFLNSEIPAAEAPIFYQWVIEEVFEVVPTDFPDPFGSVPSNCYIAQQADPQRINIFSSLEENAGTIKGRLISQKQVDYAFLSRYFINAHQLAITQGSYEYLKNIQTNINQSGSIFDIPPATIIGNIYNPDDDEEIVYGYFSAALEKSTRISVSVSDLPFTIINPCQFDPFKRRNNYPAYCLRCFDDRNAIPKPDYFN